MNLETHFSFTTSFGERKEEKSPRHEPPHPASIPSWAGKGGLKGHQPLHTSPPPG